MDELDRLYRRLVQNIRAGFPELFTRGFEVSQLYQQIVPYRTNRRELGFDSNEEYELAVMQLLAGLRGYLVGDAELQKAMRTELASPNPDLAAFRVFATATVSLAPEALRALEKRSAGSSDQGANPSSLSPSEQAVLAGRATESVEVTGEGTTVPKREAAPPPPPPAPPLAPPSPPPAASPPPTARIVSAPPPAPARPPLGASAPPRRPTPLAPTDAPMAAPRSSPHPAAAGEACRYCGGVLPDGRRVTFCPNCGHNLTVQHCPACSTELEVGWKFCITCGREVGKA